MGKFKTGDRVKCVKAYDSWLTVGKEYTVTHCCTRFVCVDGDKDLNGGFEYEYFELVKEPAPKFRVGMKVWGFDCGWTVVEQVRDKEVYSINTAAGNTYTKDGKRFSDDLRPSLFLDEIKAEDWPNPPAPKPKASELKVGQHIECLTNFSNNQYLRREVVFVAGEQIWVQDIYNQNSAHKVIDWRLPSPE